MERLEAVRASRARGRETDVCLRSSAMSFMEGFGASVVSGAGLEGVVDLNLPCFGSRTRNGRREEEERVRSVGDMARRRD